MTEGDGIQLAVTAQPAVAVETVVRLSASPRSLTGDFTPAPSAVTLELVDKRQDHLLAAREPQRDSRPSTRRSTTRWKAAGSG